MKKLLFVACISLFACHGLKAQDLIIDNQTACDVWVDFHAATAGCANVALAVNTFGPGVHGPYTAAAGYKWSYGLIGNLAGCAPATPVPGCVNNHIEMSDGACRPPRTSGCVAVTATCNGGCTFFNVTAVFNSLTGDCTLTIQ